MNLDDLPTALKDWLDNLEKDEPPEEPAKKNDPEIGEESKERPRLIDRVMRRYRNFVVSVCGLGFVIIGLFPPWVLKMVYPDDLKGAAQDLGYAFVTSPPTVRVGSWHLCARIDFSRLIVEWIVWGLICGTAYLKRDKTRPKRS
jgi:hypothetical protein